MEPLKNITINISGPKEDQEMMITLGPYSSIGDWISVFKTILIHQTFHEDLVKNLFEGNE